MRYTFKDIYNESMLEESLVMFITGQYSVFNNMVIDELKKRCQPSSKIQEDAKILALFGILGVDEVTGEIIEESTDNYGNIVDFQNFMSLAHIPNINGKWFCSTDYKMLSTKQRESLEKYMKSPSNNGRLVIYMQDFADYRNLLKNVTINRSKNCNMIQLNFPNRTMLYKIVASLFAKRNITLSEKALELFIIRMSNSYDRYEEVIDKIAMGREGSCLSYEETLNSLSGEENFVLDDFVYEMIKPMSSDKLSNKRSIYKILGALINDIGATKLVSKLRYKINDYIEFRLAINEGYIPIRIRFDPDEIKKKLPENSKIAKISDMQFSRMAHIASETSLRDWIYMKFLISNIAEFETDLDCEKALYSLIHRTTFNDSRLDNDIGIDNVIENSMHTIDKVYYNRGN